MAFTYKHAVHYYETDKMGIVHHSNYIRFFEESRTAFFEAKGLSYKTIEDMGLIVPVLGVECEYKSTTTYGDLLLISPRLEVFNGLKFTFSYTVSSEDGKTIYAVGKTTHCFLNADFKPTLVKKTHPLIYEHMLNLLEAQNN